MSNISSSHLSSPNDGLGSTNTGLPNGRELFETGYSWQHAVSQLEGNPDSPLIHMDFSFFDKKENQDWTADMLMKGRSLAENTYIGSTEQQDLNQLLGRIAVLSRATVEIGTRHPEDEQLKGSHTALLNSYLRYRQHLDVVGGRDDSTNVQSLVGSLVALTGVLIQPHGGMVLEASHAADYNISNAPAVNTSSLNGAQGGSQMSLGNEVQAGLLGGMTSDSRLKPPTSTQAPTTHGLRRFGSVLGSMRRRKAGSGQGGSKDQ